MSSFSATAFPLVVSQNGRDNHENHGHGWDIRLAVPGEPGSDYPTLGTIPRTSFSCAGREPGYYADFETNCQVFRICTIGATYGFQSFLCPNGTLFNQGVFVCDWWMNVKCEKSEPQLDNNVGRFSNLRLGPQLMKDVKKMLTHPMRNPYDLTSMRGNLIVMQDYKPPVGQLFPNGALLAGPERTPNNVYIPAKQIQPPQNFNDNNDLVFAASTPEPRYLPAAFNTIQPSTQDVELFQKQRLNGQFAQYNRVQNGQNQQRANLVSNGHSGKLTQSSNSAFTNNNVLPSTQPAGPRQNYNQIHSQVGLKQNSVTASTFNTQNTQRGQLNVQSSQNNNNKNYQLNNQKQSELGFSRQQYNINNNQERQTYTYNTPSPSFLNEINEKLEVKQNLVSTNQAPKPTIIAKTLTLSRLVDDPKPGKPKSRITVKTWIVKPSKSGKLITPTPYTYNRPTRTTDSTPYVYNRPTTYTQTERFITESDEPYVYNRPTVATKQIAVTTSEPLQPYVYNRPTVATKQIAITTKESPDTYPPPTAPRPTFSGRQYLAPIISTPTPTRASQLYLPPTTFKPAARIYLPPTENESPSPVILARQYLPPDSIQPSYFPSARLRQAPTTQTTIITTSTTNTNPTFTFTKQSQINTNDNNLTFSDILTKEKLDITVNDIVKDTSKFLNTASPGQFGQLKQDVNYVDYLEDKYLPSEQTVTDSGEILTSQTPAVSKSSKLISAPAIDLEPPIISQENHHITNQLSNLPFFKEPPIPTNTIERTVSLKISIPEKVADYLFNRHNDTDYSRLEILNTGSSNYLVITNNPYVKPTGTSFIPIGKLIEDKNSNISDSQALVFSLLADSINVAKEYNNLAKQDTAPSAPAVNHDNEDVSPITNRISQLTSSQYGHNNNANAVTTIRPTTISNELDASIDQKSPQRLQQSPISPPQPSQTQQSARLQNADFDENTGYPYSTNTQLYSGQLYQLPVPVVTSKIYNKGSAKLTLPNIHSENFYSNTNDQTNRYVKTTQATLENIHSETLPPARLQINPTSSSKEENFNNQNDINQFLINNSNEISAQIKDQITGTIQHPLENNKLINYKKDQTYYIYTKLNNGLNGNELTSQPIQSRPAQSAKLIQTTNTPKVVSFQFIPSVSYQFEDEKDQQKILNAFHIDEFGSPKSKSGKIQDLSQGRPILTSDVSYTVDHTQSEQSKSQYNDISTLYNGPSSYSAPQASIGNLRLAQVNNFNAKLIQNNSNGYPRNVPTRQFNY
ncbi:probable serine/threonine-protein kinase nek3 isoform X1 [Amyelois transitella]|uniref:probable serine/threonine-protein kinase nek3 isoform X1 n=1 Tax=Amyelois transitella TaxID=680683 RepID=UPI00298FFE04|nr:probable serine/threonine-protein kinase nek3 isoform X1 [Amyelois transitella]